MRCVNCNSINIDTDQPKFDQCLSCGLRSFKIENPIIGTLYKCYRDRIFLGEAIYTDDKNVGLSFIKMSVSPDGELIHEVLQPNYIEYYDNR